MRNRRTAPLVGATCLIAATSMTVGEGAFRWLLLGIAALMGIVLAIRALRAD